jgi:hypothetical protein
MSKTATMVLAILAMLAIWAAPVDRASAYDRFHGHIGIYLGSPWVWGPYPYYPPVAVYPQSVYVQPESQTYVQRQPGYWYYCADSNAYYPYVQACPSGWMQVVPQNAPAQ